MKISLLAAVLTVAVSGFAQSPSEGKVKVRQHLPTLMQRQYMADMQEKQSSPKKTKASGVYYTRPEGAYYLGFDLNGMGYYSSVLSVAPWHTVTFVNANAQKKGDWHMYAYNQKYEFQGEVLDDPTSAVNENGDFEWSQNPGEFYYTPTLTSGEESFSIGQENRYLRSTGRNYVGRIICDTLTTVVAADDHQAYEYRGVIYNNSVVFGLFSDNMYGTGIADDQYESYGAIQPFDRPMSPLYVERVFAHGNSSTRQPIAEGDTLFCYVSKCMKRVMSNGAVVKMPTYEYTDTLYAFAGDTIDFASTDVRGDKTIYTGTILFSKRADDGQGNSVSVPFIINPSDFDENGFAFVFQGFDRPGMDAGIWGYRVNSDVDDPNLGLMLFRDIKTKDNYVNFYGDITMQVGMVCMYDAVDVKDDGGMNILRISSDGQTCYTEGASEGESLDGAAVFTATSWYDADGNAFYTLEGLPDWVSGINIDDSMRRKAGTMGQNIVSFVCEPLPNGVTDRSATIYVAGKGVKSEKPIIIHQSIPDDIIAVEKSSPADTGIIYNAGGQRVGANANGLVISKGKKYIRK